MKIYQDARREKQANTIRGSGNPNWKGGRITKYCIRCGSPFQVYPSGNHHTHCSLLCANRDLADAQKGIPNKKKGRSGFFNALFRKGFMWRGEANKNFKGDNGKTKLNAKIRSSIYFKEWREKVFKRDNFTCQYCRKRGGNLEAHHIRPFATFPELRFKVSNGITLCRDCHKKTFKNNIPAST